jgi:hypothetical protein
MEFSALPDSPDSPRYAARAKAVASLLKAKEGRLVEEGMWMDRRTAEDDFWWFLWRFTTFADPELRNPGCGRSGYRIRERRHPLRGRLWVEHPWVHWLARQYQRLQADPAEGPVWIKAHRESFKTTLLLLFISWLHARDEMETAAVWTHSVDKIGANMGRGALENLQMGVLGDHWPQFRVLKAGTALGYTLDRPPGPKDQSFSVFSILAAIESVHPTWAFLDDVVSDRLRGNIEQIARVDGKIAAIIAALPPEAPLVFANTPHDEADPLMQRQREGGFGRIIEQWATEGGRVLEREGGRMVEYPAFTPRGEPNLRTRAFFEAKRADMRNDSIYFPQFEGIFHKSGTVLFDWEKIRKYEEKPEEIAKNSPFLNIFIDGAGGGKGADFMVIRVTAWTAHDAWANLELIRERVGQTVAMQLLLGRDETDPRTGWLPETYPRYLKRGVVEYWMEFDPQLTVWFDDNTAAGWREAFLEHIRLRQIRFANGKVPTVKKWPEVHVAAQGERPKDFGKAWHIRRLEHYYSQGKAAYPKAGFGHGSMYGLAGGQDKRDTLLQFKEDEFSRMELGGLPPFDDMLDTERVMCMEKATAQMRRPAKGGGFRYGEREFPAVTMRNPWGLPQTWFQQREQTGGRRWMTM